MGSTRGEPILRGKKEEVGQRAFGHRALRIRHQGGELVSVGKWRSERRQSGVRKGCVRTGVGRAGRHVTCHTGGWDTCHTGEAGDTLTCLHLLRLLIQVPLIPPPLRVSVALTVTIEQSPPFPINSLRVPYLDTVPYQSRLSDVILRSCSI